MLPATGQGLTLAHFTDQLEDLRDTSLTLELNLSTFGTHPRVTLGHMGQSKLELNGKGQSKLTKLELSGNGNECKPLPRTRLAPASPRGGAARGSRSHPHQ